MVSSLHVLIDSRIELLSINLIVYSILIFDSCAIDGLTILILDRVTRPSMGSLFS